MRRTFRIQLLLWRNHHDGVFLRIVSASTLLLHELFAKVRSELLLGWRLGVSSPLIRDSDVNWDIGSDFVFVVKPLRVSLV